jgi:hypothetical protein
MPQQKQAQEAVSQIDVSMAFVHRANIARCKWMLTTDLIHEDRIQIERRLAEEEASLLKLAVR